ncbi:hypothetical protein MXD62_12150 [Frankia sp. Mgl5]|nr:hypothetical protein [Frankia sp. Mgl5]
MRGYRPSAVRLRSHGTTFAAAGGGGGGGGPTVFAVDPARLVRLACAGEDAPDERWWSRELPGVLFLDPCTR